MSPVKTRVGAAALTLVSALVVGGVASPAPAQSAPRQPSGLRAFDVDSWWNTPLPKNAPGAVNEAAILNYMQTAEDAGGGCLRLAGTGTNAWGQPVFFAGPGDPSYDVQVPMSKRPPELADLRIPRKAAPAATSDAAMTVYDRSRGYVVALTGARYNGAAGRWSARGATVTYLDSNGLHWRTGRSDDRRNYGSHRGNNGATMMVRYGEVKRGAIRHVLKVASGPETSTRFVFPMVGSDGDSTDANAPLQGMRFRIKPSVDIESLGLNPQAEVIAKALQRYGMYLGDNAGNTTLKLQDTRASGMGQQWRLSAAALCRIPIGPRYWDVVQGGYDPSRGR